MSFIPDRRVVRAAGIALAATGLALGAACATGSALRQARSAEQSRDFDLAVAHYSRVVHADPDNREARSGLDPPRSEHDRSRARAFPPSFDGRDF